MDLVMHCPFCPPPSACFMENSHAVAFFDGYPVSPGHALVIPRRHAASLFELDAEERAAVWELVGEVREWLCGERGPAAFNIGLNDGEEAGQTVRHAHVHVIPRYAGDVADPRGGVRWVVPEKADYWSDR
jgi:diadenosine tetraphosphate (Ap4A) HIT family hydrolase